jgi:tRNA (guanine-N7-)-methyltransferase
LTTAQERALRDLWPAWGIDHTDTRLDLAAVFGRAAPCVLEIGFGNGETLVEGAVREPGKNFLGIEVHRPGVGRLLMRVEQRELGNVRVICHDAVEVLRDQLPPASLDLVNIFFPDPWPKKRHHKRRLIQPPFLALLAQTMKPRARLHIATDWLAYAEHIHECLKASELFSNTQEGGSLDDALQSGKTLRGETKFERRGRKLGHDVWDFVYATAER